MEIAAPNPISQGFLLRSLQGSFHDLERYRPHSVAIIRQKRREQKTADQKIAENRITVTRLHSLHPFCHCGFAGVA